MIVTKLSLNEALEKILSADRIALDTETTGLKPYKGDRVFSLIIATKEEEFYFNFNDKPDHLGDITPDIYNFKYDDLKELYQNFPKFERIYIHNAKFDLHFMVTSFGLYLKDLLLNSNIYCTEALSRLVRNDLLSYSLANLGSLIGHEKDDKALKYINEHKLYTLIDTGKKEPEKLLHYDLIPFEIIYIYGLQDARVCFKLGEYVVNRLEQYNFEQLAQGFTGNTELVANELRLTKILFKMENIGVAIDANYCEEALEYYRKEIELAKAEFLELTGMLFADSRKVLKPAFDKLGLSYPVTDKGNASFKEEVLEGIDNPIANIIKRYRAAYKSAFTYYKNFLDLSDNENILHTNLRQGGTTTGRMSCREPNLQNVPKRADKGVYKARKAFVPRKGYFFAMLDYDQMEYRLFMDYAAEKELIQKVLDGLDVHEATAEMVGIERDPAKTVNFSLLYGSGDKALAENLKLSLEKGKALKAQYFSNLKNIKTTTKQIISTVENRGYIFNLLGRRCYIPKKLAYKAPNYLIQGGCGDIVKKAMISIDDYLNDKNSRMILQIHDEILLEIDFNEYHILEDIRNLMVKAYTHEHLPLTAGIDYSLSNWYDKKGVDYELLKNFNR